MSSVDCPSERRQQQEREGDEHVEAGQLMRFESTDEFVAHLDSVADGPE